MNPIVFLREIYHYLNMESAPGKPPSDTIWVHDDELLTSAEAFYRELATRLDSPDWPSLVQRLGSAAAASKLGGEAAAEACRASHRGFQAATSLLLMIPRLGVQSGLLEITINDALEPVFPKVFLDEQNAANLRRALAPPPKASANEIVTPSGGSYYSREAPHLPPLVCEGDHFEAGQPLFIIEVMKMFNKVLAPFAGTVKKNIMLDSDGAVVRAGQTIFEIEPDEVVVEESDATRAGRRERVTLAALGG